MKEILLKSIPYALTVLITATIMFFFFKGCNKPEPVIQFPVRDSELQAKIDSVQIRINDINLNVIELSERVRENENQKIINNYYYAVEKEKIKAMSKDSLYKWLLKELNK